MEARADHSSHVQLADTARSLSRRTSCFDVFKSFSKSAWRKFGGATRDSRSNVPAHVEPPIQSLIVDEDEENTPPVEDHLHGSDALEVDPNETSEFTFDSTSPMYPGNAVNRYRVAALCARYGIPHDPELLKPSPYGDVPSDPLRVSKRARQRIRVSCHVCNSVFKGERICQKCGHGKCGDCGRRPVTEPRPLSDRAAIISIDSSDDEESTAGSPDPELVPAKAVISDLEISEPSEPRPVIERSKYICHMCFGEFASVTNFLCEACGHEKCQRCSRQVTRISYPYDEASGSVKPPRQNRVYRPCKQRVRHFCDHCGGMFAPRTRVCSACLHTRCKNCTRQPRKRRRVEAGPDPAEPEASPGGR